MRKILLICTVLFLLAGLVRIASADGVLNTTATINLGFTGLDAGTFLDMIDHNQILVGMTTPLIGIKKILTANGGVLTDFNNKPIILGSLDVNLKNVLAAIGWDYFWLGEPMKIGGWLGNDIDSNSHGMHLGKAHGGIYFNVELPLPSFLQ